MERLNFTNLVNKFDRAEFTQMHEEMSFAEHLDLLREEPNLVRSAYQTVYDMIMAEGTSEFERYRKVYTHYNFFDDKDIPIFGLEETLDSLVKFFRGAAGWYGPEQRILLLHGPVGSSKSTILRLLKKRLEAYSRTEAGRWYTYKWVNLPVGAEGIYTQTEDICPMHDNPLRLLPFNLREEVLEDLNQIHRDRWVDDGYEPYDLRCNGELNPRCRKFMETLLLKYKGDIGKVLNEHIRVVRKQHSEIDRCGIATFQPKDEKNQDATELTGDINYAKLPHFGSDSDARAFNFDGEFCVGNRGIVEFIEMLKLAQEFLYDLLGASQEQQIKPKKFPQIPVDLVLIGHTNTPEYEKLRQNAGMEALRDRTTKIDVPYQLMWSTELAILKHKYGPKRVKQHIAPHTLQIAALWAILTRLKADKDNKIDPVTKAKLYDGQSVPGWTEDSVKEMKDKYPTEGMDQGVSCRFVQDKISNCLSSNYDYVSFFMVLNELRDGLSDSTLLNKEEDIARYNTCIDLAIKELNEILKGEVQDALVGDEDAIVRLCTNYIDNIMADINETKVKNHFTGKDMAPDEKLMRAIEEKAGVPDQAASDFRKELAGFIGHLGHKGKQFTWKSNPKLEKALKMKLFEDTKDTIKLSALHVSGATIVDKDIQEKIDAIKTRLIKNYGYNEQSATDVLDYVGGIFARGDMADED